MKRSLITVIAIVIVAAGAFALGASFSSTSSLQAAGTAVEKAPQQRPRPDAPQEETRTTDAALATAVQSIAESLQLIAENSGKIEDIDKRLVEIIDRLEGIEEELAWTRLDRGKELTPAPKTDTRSKTGKR
jgi:flagellar basal body-associated protein FliL